MQVAKCAALLISLILSAPVLATTTVVDFTQVTHVGGSQDLISNGVFFSPQCHFDLAYQQDDPTPPMYQIDSPHGTWLGFDESGCVANEFSAGPNPRYSGPDIGLGPAQAFVRMQDYSAFSLLSFEWMRNGGPGNMTVKSSKGGSFTLTPYLPSNTTFVFSGTEWQDLDWVVFQTFGVGGGTSGFDTLVLASADAVFVPEPGEWAAWSALLAFLGVASLGRRRL